MMRSIVIAIVTASVVAGLVIWFFLTHEPQTRDVWVGYRGEARFNQLLAAQRFVETLGYDAESRAELRPEEWTPPPSDTLVIAERAHYTKAESDALLLWVERGGHLLITPGSSERDHLFTTLEVKAQSANPDDDDEEETNPDISDDDEEDTGTVEDDDDLVIGLGNWARVTTEREDGFSYSFSDEDASVALRLPHGNGYVTVIAGAWWIIDNDNLNEHDHAFFFHQLVSEIGDPGKLWFIFGADRASLWLILWENTAPAMILGALLVLLTVWYKGQRFGPMTATPKTERRSLLEHIGAAGNFQWRHKSFAILVQSAREAMLNDFTRWHPDIMRLDPKQQATLLEQHTSLDRSLIDIALGIQAEDGFQIQINAIYTLRKHL